MDDQEILRLFWDRSERAVRETETKYGGYCAAIARNILSDEEDVRETVNDVWLGAWSSIPPHRPEQLSGYLAKLTRNLCLKRRRDDSRQKRGGGESDLAYEELADCLIGPSDPQSQLEGRELADWLGRFLRSLPDTERRVFLSRYWYFDSIDAIARRFGFSDSKVKSMLHRTRARLRRELKKEGLL